MKLGEDIDGEAEADYSGSSLSLSSDGKTVAIGSPAGYDESCEGLHNGMIIVLRGRIVAAFEWGVSYVACCVILEGVLKPRYIYSYVLLQFIIRTRDACISECNSAATYKANEMMQNIARDISVPEHPESFSSSL